MIIPIKKIRAVVLVCLLLLPLLKARASEIVRVSPMSNTVLLVYIEDGFIDTYGVGENVPDHITYHDPTDAQQLYQLENFKISSTDDGQYYAAQSPINVGRKSKAIHYNDEWSAIPYVMGHWVYIQLPFALKNNKHYDLQLDHIVSGSGKWSFTYDPVKMRSEAIHVNMVGFPTSGPKYAYLSQWMGDFDATPHTNGGLNLDAYNGKTFRLVNYQTKQTVFTGTVKLRLRKDQAESSSYDFAPDYNYTRADVWECDFSDFNAPGEYVVVVDDLGCSYPFEIGTDAINEPFVYAMKGLFWQRQGIVKEKTDGSVMPRDHHYDDIKWLWDKDYLPGDDHSGDGFNTATAVQVHGIYGYYMDAGDWDGYVHHAKVPMALLMLYDLSPATFKDGDVGNRYKLSDSGSWIDEGNNGIPDLLDEAAWLIKYYKRSKDILQNNYGGTGGVPGYVGRDGVPGINITAWQDTRDWYLSGESAWATFYYAGLAAYYAECLDKFHQLTGSGHHPEYNSWRNEAINAYNWGLAHPQNTDYADSKNEELRAKGFAAALLYRLTAYNQYQDDLKAYFNWEPKKTDGEWSNQNIIDVCQSIMAMLPATHPNLDATFRADCRSEVIRKADEFKVAHNQQNAFRQGNDRDQFIQIGGVNTPRLTLVTIAHHLTGDQKYADVIHNSMNYALGGNQLNMVYLSGLGEFSDQWVFNPNGWLTTDINSMVYSARPDIGYTTYFGATDYWWYISISSEYWSRTAAYPSAIDNPTAWPGTEQKFFNQYSIQGGEFTIHQQNNYMIFNTGYRKAISNVVGGNFRVPALPTVNLLLNDNQTVSGDKTTLQATASQNTRFVRYYADWRFIGESDQSSNNFEVEWAPFLPANTEVKLTAVAISDRGAWSKYSSAGEATVLINSDGDSQTPTNPSGLYAFEIAALQFKIAWTASTDNDQLKHYEVFVDGVLFGTTPETQYTFEEVDPLSSYSIKIRAVDRSGNKSGFSNTLTVNTPSVHLGDGTVFIQSSESNGLVNMEAEDYSWRGTGTGQFEGKFWLEREDVTADGGFYMSVSDDNNKNAGGTLDGPKMEYLIDFKHVGTHYVWLKCQPDNASDNSIVLAFEGQNLGDWNLGDHSDWVWRKSELTINVSNTGIRTLGIYMREDGTKIDRIQVSRDPNYHPNQDTQPISAIITSPVEGASFEAGELIDIQTSVTGNINVVSFFRVTNGEWFFLGNDLSNPFSWQANDFPEGEHQLVIQAKDFDDIATPYYFVNITVAASETVYVQQPDGTVTFEAEGYMSAANGQNSFVNMQWQEVNDSGASGSYYMVVPDNNNANANNSLEGPSMFYDIDFTKTGKHYLWVRHRCSNGADNSITTTLEGQKISDWHLPDNTTDWLWTKCSATFNVDATGLKQFGVYMREDGTPVDQFILTNSSTFNPDQNNARELVAGSRGIVVYPNPSQGEVQVKGYDQVLKQILVYDITGKLVFQKQPVSRSYQFNISSGIYTLKVISDEGLSVHQLVVY
ncbi:cellulase N-terminal Ig-like domain-containing protein [Persicobacter diffluens]|uniref:Fibronectin type-III domain-containing protein n=1 Tax=Persicobacter diffluens TaxID=981 RepID=A0AAN5ALV5_9BACT|nr:hypothetical protein PEDI_49420 [Persicobacter diffluens]